MDADLEQQIPAVAPIAQVAHCLAHAQGGGNRPVGGRKGRHHRVADGLDDGPGFGGDDLVEDLEMRPHQVEGGEIADPLVKLRRAFEVGKQKGQAGDLEPLVDIHRVGAVEVAKHLRRNPICKSAPRSVSSRLNPIRQRPSRP
jgi:hypothetical protein